ncbi:PqqD family protein [Novosphingobium sp.]|uniref:PqqD family protein n=1 Tax=Novosphingobium sp. TaxID=1874826 RepID=UPI00286EB223|nr:PqqD family protein [Novosphingobium sp.]
MIFEKLPDAFGAAEVDGEIVLISASSGEFFAIKGSGVEIWRLLDESGDVDDITTGLTKQFAIDADAARSEVVDFLGQLEALRFVRRGG